MWWPMLGGLVVGVGWKDLMRARAEQQAEEGSRTAFFRFWPASAEPASAE
jgi:hypothetical protein